jgi:hypothetical protein
MKTCDPVIDDALEHGINCAERVLALLLNALNVEESQG